MCDNAYTHILGISPGWAFFGMITMGLDHRETLCEIIPAFSSSSNVSQIDWVCVRAKVQNFCTIWGQTPVSISMVGSLVWQGTFMKGKDSLIFFA